ncbi:MAG: hypothetical protein WC460_02405 [Patescibacteria group bacterium]
MKNVIKTILIIIVFIVLAIAIAIAFTTFLAPKEELTRYSDCILLQNSKTGKIGCFGCANNICKDASKDWVTYKKPEIGIPYACFKSDQGCELAQ